jgi:GTP cyclohydrolase I
MPVNRALAQKAISDLLKACDLDADAMAAVTHAPELFVHALEHDWICGYRTNLGQLLAAGTEILTPPAPVVVLSDIATATLCPHHLLPAEGRTSVAYLPGKRLLGLGTIARLVQACSRRLIMQENIGRLVVDSLVELGGARGAYCRIVLKHMCLRLRGARQSDAVATSVHTAGEFETGQGREQLAWALNQPHTRYRESAEL